MTKHPASRNIANRILLALPPRTLDELLPSLNWVELARGQIICRAGTPVEHVYFVNRGLTSLIRAMRDGRTAEVGAIGIEGIAGLSALFGFDRAILDTIVQIPGEAFRIRETSLRDAMSRSKPVQMLLQHYLQWAISQIAQTAACNRLHSLEERCCRWLLIAHDSARSDTFSLRHEFFALMLGVQRSSVSLTAGILRKAGFIDYHAGRMTIVDRAGLEGSHANVTRQFASN